MPHRDLLPREARQFGIPIGGIGDGTRIGGAAALPPEDLAETAQRMKTALLWFFGQRVDAVLGRRELAEAERAMVLMMVVLMMILRRRRGLSHAAHQAQGTANASATASEGGARRHRPAALTEGVACQVVVLVHAPIISKTE